LNYRIGQRQTTTEFKASDTYAISSHLLNSVTVSGLILDSLQTRTAPFSIFDFGSIHVTPPDPRFRETGITVTGFSGWGSGGTQPPGEWVRDNVEISEMLTWIRGGHSLHAGAGVTPYVRFDSATGFQEEPVLNFNGTFTGNAMADFLLGRINTFTQTAGKAKFTRGRATSAFVQEDWRVGPRLTMDVGLRWDPFLPYSDPVAQQVGGYLPGFRSQRFPGAPAGLAFAGDPGFPSAGMHANLGNLAPRVGFAFAARQGAHATTLRGGWGRFFIQPFTRLYNNFVQNAPFSPSVTLFGADLGDPYGSAGVVNPFPPFAPVYPTAATTFALPVQYQYFDPNWHLGHLDAWNATVERQLVRNLVARASYVETRGRDLQSFLELNPALYSPSATVGSTNARRPLAPGFASLIEMTNGGHSEYRSLQLTLEKRVGGWGGFVAHYTFSRSVDNESVDAQFTLANPNPFVPGFNDGRSDFDVPHNFSLWGLLNPPVPASAPAWLRRPLGRWEVTGIWTWRSGTPFTVASGQDRSLSGVGLDRADLAGAPSLSSGRPTADVVNGFFDVNAFRLNLPGTFGTAPRNLLRNPSFGNVDLSVQKSFPIGGGRRIRLLADLFNVTNAVHFNQPGANLSSPSTFGKITSAGEPRIVQLAARLDF
jgi:hypothetical protein